LKPERREAMAMSGRKFKQGAIIAELVLRRDLKELE
jgi:hypothetical protein